MSDAADVEWDARRFDDPPESVSAPTAYMALRELREERDLAEAHLRATRETATKALAEVRRLRQAIVNHRDAKRHADRAEIEDTYLWSVLDGEATDG